MATSGNGSGSTSSQDRENTDSQEIPIPLPPPPPAEGPDWHQMMANQAQLINLLAQSLNQNQEAAVAAQPQAYAPPQPRTNTSEFMRMRPPTFSSSTEPMHADDWLRAIGKKLDITQCIDRERVLFASHQLNEPASEWWDNFT